MVSIHEVPAAFGQVRKDHVAVPAASLPAGALERGTALPAEGPFVDERYWIPAGEAPSAGPEVLAPWTPIEFVLRHLEAVIRSHLAELVGHQEVRNLLDQHKLYTEDSADEVIRTEHCESMDPLTRLVRALAAERVPVGDFPTVYGIFRSAMDAGRPHHEIVDQVRRAPTIRPRLWGNDGARALLPLDPRLAERVAVAVDARGRVSDERAADEIVRAVGEALAGHRGAALIAPDAGTRRGLWRIVAPHHPDVPILARAELSPGLGARLGPAVELAPS
jgi:flagellar biosynthesis component FlhA